MCSTGKAETSGESVLNLFVHSFIHSKKKGSSMGNVISESLLRRTLPSCQGCRLKLRLALLCISGMKINVPIILWFLPNLTGEGFPGNTRAPAQSTTNDCNLAFKPNPDPET